MVSNGSGEVGALKLTNEIMTIVTRVPDIVKSLTGIDIAKVTLFRIILSYSADM